MFEEYGEEGVRWPGKIPFWPWFVMLFDLSALTVEEKSKLYLLRSASSSRSSSSSKSNEVVILPSGNPGYRIALLLSSPSSKLRPFWLAVLLLWILSCDPKRFRGPKPDDPPWFEVDKECSSSSSPFEFISLSARCLRREGVSDRDVGDGWLFLSPVVAGAFAWSSSEASSSSRKTRRYRESRPFILKEREGPGTTTCCLYASLS